MASYEVIYSDWFIINMKDHVSPIDLYNLKMSTKYHYNLITYSDIKYVIISNIINKLQEMIDVKINDLLKFMDKYEITISGSFIIQCILNEYWVDSDVDMYTYSSVNLNKNIFVNNNYTVSGYTTENEYATLKYIKMMGVFEKHNKLKVQLIVLDTDKDIYEYVKTTCDFDVCKNIFNIKNGKCNLQIHNLQNIMNKQISCNFLGMSCTMPTRKLKYEKRGFIFKNHIIGNYTYYNGVMIPIIMCNNKQVTIFKENFIVDSIEKQVICDEWFYIDSACENCTDDYFNCGPYTMEIKNLFLADYATMCGKNNMNKPVRNIEYNCPIKCLDSSIVHYHSQIKYKQADSIHYIPSIIIEYNHNETLTLYDNFNEKHNNLFINFEQFCVAVEFPIPGWLIN